MAAPVVPGIEPTELWVSRVAACAAFPDQRLTSRFADILSCWAAKPLDAIPQACDEWAQAKATYRFLSNDRVSVAGLLRSYVTATVHAARGRRTLYVIHDTTSFNYSALKQTTGLGPINDSPFGRGLHVHTSLAVQPDGTPVGLLHQRYWARPVAKQTIPPQQREPKDRESIKWLEGVNAATVAINTLPLQERPRLIHVGDREGDITDLLRHIVGGPDGLVIRSQHDRRVLETPGTAHAAVAATKKLGDDTVTVKATNQQPKREARLEVRAITLTMRPTTDTEPPIRCGLVEVREVGPLPAGVAPLLWRLWTTEPITTLAEAQAVIAIYEKRPRIEEFHLVLKSGCRAERLELETATRLQKALIIYSGIAVRIVTLRDIAQRQPNTPCTCVLNKDEWQALYARFERRLPTPTTQPPTVEQAVKWIGRLGGHLGRKCDGRPGVRVLWRGWRDLDILVAGFRAGRQLDTN